MKQNWIKDKTKPSVAFSGLPDAENKKNTNPIRCGRKKDCFEERASLDIVLKKVFLVISDYELIQSLDEN